MNISHQCAVGSGEGRDINLDAMIIAQCSPYIRRLQNLPIARLAGDAPLRSHIDECRLAVVACQAELLLEICCRGCLREGNILGRSLAGSHEDGLQRAERVGGSTRRADEKDRAIKESHNSGSLLQSEA